MLFGFGEILPLENMDGHTLNQMMIGIENIKMPILLQPYVDTEMQ
jgi:hypothetical protein